MYVSIVLNKTESLPEYNAASEIAVPSNSTVPLPKKQTPLPPIDNTIHPEASVNYLIAGNPINISPLELVGQVANTVTSPSFFLFKRVTGNRLSTILASF